MSSQSGLSGDRLSNGNLVPTGIRGLDDILNGGLPSNHVYLVEGNPGTGKTTMSLKFLLHGVAKGERGLYVSLSETEKELRDVAASHGWNLDGVNIFELPPEYNNLDDQYTVFHPSEIELSDITKAILKKVAETDPQRVVLDSLSEVRLLAGDALRYRRQILASQVVNGTIGSAGGWGWKARCHDEQRK